MHFLLPMVQTLGAVQANTSAGETLVVVMGSTINSLDIHRSGTNRPSYQVAVNCYDRLLTFGTKTLEDGSLSYDYDNLQGELAESWEVLGGLGRWPDVHLHPARGHLLGWPPGHRRPAGRYSSAQGRDARHRRESGSGKSVTSYALLRILDRAGKMANGSIVLGGVDIGGATERTMSEMRGRELSMIFQNPRAALNPIRAVGRQIEDVLIQHGLATRGNARNKAIQMLEADKIRDPEQRYHAYPFELSGGMCQRIVIAIQKPQGTHTEQGVGGMRSEPQAHLS
ncbi:ATP-binding cassette domain-containing protein [Halomonas sp. PGE1]|uniref:ATP-binding cassette domain-containing protein n=1 Tax=Halomonas sp. PGE1 TaxID=2730360 RepID=UPI001B8CB470|nr:ATP-binding cassette domain-containing protein [Halomonas sp. PGE1]